jgi:hypothetical protein
MRGEGEGEEVKEYDCFERMQEGCFIVGTPYKIVLYRQSS